MVIVWPLFRGAICGTMPALSAGAAEPRKRRPRRIRSSVTSKESIPMSFAQTVRGAASSIAEGGDPREAVSDALGEAAEGFGLDPGDFLAAREQGASVGTRIEQQNSSINSAGEALNRSSYERGRGGSVHVICPMVIPKGRTFTT